MDDDYYAYRHADTEEQRRDIRNRFSDQEMFESAMVWSMHDYRKRAYPPIEEQLDTIYRNGLEHWKSEIQDIKSKYPDMTNAYTKKHHDTTLDSKLANIKTQLDEARADLEEKTYQLISVEARLQALEQKILAAN